MHMEQEKQQNTFHSAKADISSPDVISQNAEVVSEISYINPILAIMNKQNEITAMLVQQECLSSVPIRKIQMSDGDPLKYHTFIRAF